MNRSTSTRVGLALVGSALLAPLSLAQTISWRYYRTGNTGIQGDYNEAIWIGPDDDPWIAGYNPFFEEGGIAKYVQAEDRWINVSNVDHPELGSPSLVGSSRVHDIAEDPEGGLWLATWRGLVHFDPQVGPDSIVRYDALNSPHPGGRTMDVEVAPDGTLWAAVFSVSWGGGGLLRLDPSTGTWTLWNYGSTANGWPALGTSCERVAAWAKPGGGYLVFVKIDNTNEMAIWDSELETFTVVPPSFDAGTLRDLAGHDPVDEAGNLWAYRMPPGGGLLPRLEVLRTDGSWFVPPAPGPSGSELVHAFGNLEALSVDGNSVVSRFDGTSWTSYGAWKSGGFSYAVAIDSQGAVWASGIGGAARRDPVTGVWQRHRVTNSSQGDYWVNDLALGADGHVWLTSNYAPGTGGIQRFDGARWECFNGSTYGLGHDWPFPTDNAGTITWRSSSGHAAFSPMFGPIAEWDGDQFLTLPDAPSGPESIVEDSQGRLWSLGTYFSLRYLQDGAWDSVPIAGWGANVVVDPSAPGSVWACANLEVVRTDGSELSSWLNTDLPELNPLHDVFTTVAAAPDGTAWAGSTEGLFHLDPFSGTHEHWGPGSGLPGDQVSPLAVGPDGRVWFTNFNSPGVVGLGWFDGETFGLLPVEEGGLPHAQISDAELRTVPGGYELWLSCLSRGVAVMTVEEPAAHVAYGCDLNPAGSLEVVSDAALGDVLEVALANPLGTQDAGSLAVLALSFQGLASPCGLLLSGAGMAPDQPGELLLAPPFAYVSAGVVWDGPGTAAAISVPIPAVPDLLGVELVAQGVLVDSSGPVPNPGLTRAVTLSLGL